MAAKAPVTKAVEQDLEEARRIVLSVLGAERARVYLFGSRAWGRPSGTADIDIGILPEAPLSTDTLSRIREALEESHIPFRVDVVDLSAVDVRFRSKVVREGVRWSA